MDNAEKKFTVQDAPEWAGQTLDEALAVITEDKSPLSVVGVDNANICHLHRRIFRTSSTKNEDYYSFVYNLGSSEILQGAAVNDYFIGKQQRMELHRLGVIRNSEYIDKKKDSLTRVLDDEEQSSQGSISLQKKIHIMVSDLRLGDMLVLEYSIITEFSDENSIDPEFIRLVHNFPQSSWTTTDYAFVFVNNRTQDVAVKKRYFRDNQGGLVEEVKTVRPKETFIFEEKNFQVNSGPDEMAPFLEIATVASWKEVSNFLEELYAPGLKKDNTESSMGLFHALMQGISDEERQVRKVIEYVQEHIVYNFDADAMHGHIPQSIDETLKTQAGDCKAKSLLLVKFLSNLGIKANLVLVNYELGFYTNLELPSPFVFNHMIVKIYYKDRVYFVDPTVRGQRGVLGKRSHPFVPYYLEIGGEPNLQSMPETEEDLYLEEEVDVVIKKGVGKLEVHTTYRYASADNIRLRQRSGGNLQRIQEEIKYYFGRLDYPNDKPMSEFITEVEHKVLHDDEQQNEIKEIFKASLPKPYIPGGDPYMVVKYYNFLNLSNIDFPYNKDAVLGNFVEYPRKFILTIRGDRFYKRHDPIARRNTKISNKYFEFSNKKKISFKKIRVTAEYRPKISMPIDPDDLESLKKDYYKVNDSNFGVGIAYEFSKRWLILLIVAVSVFGMIFLRSLLDS